MKLKVGDLVDNARGNVKDMGYISDIKENKFSENKGFVFITFFRYLDVQKMSYLDFNNYYKVISHVSIPSR